MNRLVTPLSLLGSGLKEPVRIAMRGPNDGVQKGFEEPCSKLRGMRSLLRFKDGQRFFSVEISAWNPGWNRVKSDENPGLFSDRDWFIFGSDGKRTVFYQPVPFPGDSSRSGKDHDPS
ncbi:MAG: hypothetical protein C4530_19615 [Desulfobacteraceae bacterium]|nr:MAG: hypothetical protein C4530_19615 [Desulfobacteraceae bacterium]